MNGPDFCITQVSYRELFFFIYFDRFHANLLYFRIFLGIVETIVGALLCCGMGLVQHIFNLLY